MSEYPSSRIRVDWTIPIWGVLGLVGQALVIAWWGATMQARVSTLEAWQASMAPVPASIARLEERSQRSGEILDRLDAKINSERRR